MEIKEEVFRISGESSMGDITLRLMMGEPTEGIYPLMFQLKDKRTLSNRLRYWLFSKFFPFKVEWL